MSMCCIILWSAQKQLSENIARELFDNYRDFILLGSCFLRTIDDTEYIAAHYISPFNVEM